MVQEGRPGEWQSRRLRFWSRFWHNFKSELLRSFVRVIIIFKRQWVLRRFSIRSRMFLPGCRNAPCDEDCNDSRQGRNNRASDSVWFVEAHEQESDEKRDHAWLRKTVVRCTIQTRWNNFTSTSAKRTASWTWWLEFLSQAEDEL